MNPLTGIGKECATRAAQCRREEESHNRSPTLEVYNLRGMATCRRKSTGTVTRAWALNTARRLSPYSDSNVIFLMWKFPRMHSRYLKQGI